MNSPHVVLSSVAKSFTRKRGLLHAWSRSGEHALISVFRGVNLSLEPGEIAALTGANGSGKTTLLKIIAGLILSDAGRRSVSGSFYYVPAQDHSFYDRLSGRENLRFFAMLRGLPAAEAEKRIRAAESLLDLDFLHARLQEFSSGMKQKLSLARCLMMAPDILLLDEPWRSLDAEFSALIRERVFENRAGGRIILYATHNPAEAGWAGRTLHLDQGILHEETVTA